MSWASRREHPPFPPYVEAMAYLDAFVQRRKAQLFISCEGHGVWVAVMSWHTDEPSGSIVGYTGAGESQGKAVLRLAQTLQDDVEGEGVDDASMA